MVREPDLKIFQFGTSSLQSNCHCHQVQIPQPAGQPVSKMVPQNLTSCYQYSCAISFHIEVGMLCVTSRVCGGNSLTPQARLQRILKLLSVLWDCTEVARGSQLPCSENMQGALGRGPGPPPNIQQQLTNPMSESPWRQALHLQSHMNMTAITANILPSKLLRGSSTATQLCCSEF